MEIRDLHLHRRPLAANGYDAVVIQETATMPALKYGTFLLAQSRQPTVYTPPD